MSDLLHVLAAAALWTAVIVRMELVLCNGAQRSHWLSLAMLACAQTLQISTVYQAVETAMGVFGGASVLKHVFAVLAAAGVRSLLVGVLDQPTRHRFATAMVTSVVLVVMIVPFLLEPPRVLPAALAGRAEFYDDSWTVVLHWAALLAYLAWALGGASLLCWRFGRQAATGFLRTGLMLVGAGTTIGYGYIALKVAVLIAWSSSPSVRLVRTDALLESIILATAIGLIATGCMWEPLSSRGIAVIDAVRDWRSLRRLYPLWQALCDAVPDIALTEEDAKPAGSRRSPRHLRLQLVRRVVEIRDGQMALRPYADLATASAARVAVNRAGLDGVEALAVIEACWVESARRAKLTGAGAVHALEGSSVGGLDLREEVAWLERVARAVQHSPVVAAIAHESIHRTTVRQDAS